jgi:hypothetical protein
MPNTMEQDGPENIIEKTAVLHSLSRDRSTTDNPG